MEMFYICPVQDRGHKPYVAMMHLKSDQYDGGTEYLVLFNLNLNSHT